MSIFIVTKPWELYCRGGENVQWILLQRLPDWNFPSAHQSSFMVWPSNSAARTSFIEQGDRFEGSRHVIIVTYCPFDDHTKHIRSISSSQTPTPPLTLIYNLNRTTGISPTVSLLTLCIHENSWVNLITADHWYIIPSHMSVHNQKNKFE